MDQPSPLVVNTHELSRRPGSSRRLRFSAPAPENLGVALMGVVPGSPLALDLLLEAVTEGVLVSGTVRGVAVGECSRCLDPVTEPVEVDLQELYEYPERTAAEDEDAPELPVLAGDLLDLEPAIRDAVVTGLPFQPLCRPDCPGLCPECGARLADVGPDHRHEFLDPRWAGLATLRAPDDGAPPEGR